MGERPERAERCEASSAAIRVRGSLRESNSHRPRGGSPSPRPSQSERSSSRPRKRGEGEGAAERAERAQKPSHKRRIPVRKRIRFPKNGPEPQPLCAIASRLIVCRCIWLK
ncbi:hypothetical protein C2U70_00515 [Bradyrhizobium guangdongense]|nr:hypothetical protein C2U70_00515 [Bradyrhizobium guangdongense]